MIDWFGRGGVVADLMALQAALQRLSKALHNPNFTGPDVEVQMINAAAERIEREARLPEVDRLRRVKDLAYEERNRVVALLASMFPSGTRRTAIPGWEAEWHGAVYIDLPSGQVSWHYHDDHHWLFAHLPAYQNVWDGHTTEEKYQRVAAEMAHEIKRREMTRAKTDEDQP